MRVVLLTDNCELTGGVSKVVHEDAAALGAHGHDVIVVSACGNPARAPTAPGVACVSMGQEEILTDPNRVRAALSGLWNVRAAAQLRGMMELWNPSDTVVHLHSWSKALSSSVVSSTSGAGFGLVCTLHDYFAACPTGTFYNHQSGSICQLEPLSLSCVATHCDARSYSHKLWRTVRQHVQQSVGGMPGRISSFIVLSPVAESVLRPFLGDRPVHLLPNLISAPREMERATIREDAPFTFVGRLSYEKGVPLVVDAARQAGERPRFIGSGPIADIVEAAFGPDACSGWVAQDEVAREMRAAYALLLPSLWYEVQPTIIQEGASLGVPTIAGDRSAAVDLIEDGLTGFLFRHGDASDLARLLRELRRAPARVRNAGQTAWDRFWDEYAQRRADRVERMIEIYRSAVNDRSRTRVRH